MLCCRLTAFVIRVFCAAGKFAGIRVDPQVVCDSVRWLTANQRADGAFPELHWVIHREMTGGLQGDLGMTAFVLTSLLECQCSTMVSHETRAMGKSNAEICICLHQTCFAGSFDFLRPNQFRMESFNHIYF